MREHFSEQINAYCTFLQRVAPLLPRPITAHHLSFDPCWVPGSQVLGDSLQIMGDQAQPDPAVHARLAVIAAAVQPLALLEAADSSLDPCPPVAPGAEPVLAFIGQSLGRFLAWFGQDHLLYLALLQLAFRRCRVQPAVAGHQLRRPAKLLDMGIHTRYHLRFLARFPLKDLILTDDAALDLTQPQHPPKLDRLARPANTTVRVYDLLGKQHPVSFGFEDGNTGISLDMSALKEGIYLVKLSSASGEQIFRVVKY